MQQYLISLKSLAFSDKWGNFIVREEYNNMLFAGQHYLDKFISDRKVYYQNLYNIDLVVSPKHMESLGEDNIIRVFELVAEAMNLPKENVLTRRRSRDHFMPRWYAMKICKDRGLSEQVIADKIGFDRTSIIHGLKSVKNLINLYPDQAKTFAMVTDYALYSLKGKFKEDGSGELKKLNKKLINDESNA